MTLQELYRTVGGDYDQALRVLRVEKLLSAGESMDSVRLFESAHAVKGISANLGLTALSETASRITEEFRPGNPRRLSDDDVRALLQSVREQYGRIAEGIRLYAEG